MSEYLILVDENDKQWGKLEKLMVHKLGLLHRAFSVFIFNLKGELILQQRADCKYHSGGLWTNTCCSHPRFGEELSWAIERRLQEEMGMNCETEFAFNFVYKSEFENGLIEHEFDHVYFGISEQIPTPEKQEVQNWEYVTIDNLEVDLLNHPEKYTVWLKVCFPQVKKYYHETFKNNILNYSSL
jgi:isopentenyl-diphosphate delta-isomerase